MRRLVPAVVALTTFVLAVTTAIQPSQEAAAEASRPDTANTRGAAMPRSSTATEGATAQYFARSPIRHVVIIYQENHAFDDVLGVVCKHRPTPCDSHIGPVRLRNGKVVKNKVLPDIVPFVLHVPQAQQLGIHNRWHRIDGCHRPKYKCIGHYRMRDIPNLSRVSKVFPVSDRTFAMGDTASFGAHVTIAAGTINGFVGSNPHPARNQPEGPGWGCRSNRVVKWAPPEGGVQLVPSCVPDRSGKGPFRPSPVKYAPTLMESLERAGKTWHIYQGHREDRPVDDLWSVCAYFHWCAGKRFNLKFNSQTEDFVRAARRGRLPSVSLLLPVAGNSQHNRRSMSVGDNYIGRMLKSVMRSPQWRSTAVFITYDDCGCFYDHVRPPKGLGIRLPMTIVSPYSKYGFTDRHQAIMPWSMLAFVEHNFNLRPLTRATDNAYDYRFSFNFNRRPRKGIRLTTTKIPHQEKLRLAAMPPLYNDGMG